MRFDIVKMENATNTEVEQDANAFRRSKMMERTPVTPLEAAAIASSRTIQRELQGNLQELGRSNQRVFTPTPKSSVVQESGLDQDGHNMQLKQLVVNIKPVVITAERQQKALRLRAGAAESALTEAVGRTAVRTMETLGVTVRRKETRSRLKMRKFRRSTRTRQTCADNERNDERGSGRRTVDSQRVKKEKRMKKIERKTEPKNKKKRQPRRENSKSYSRPLYFSDDKGSFGAAGVGRERD